MLWQHFVAFHLPMTANVIVTDNEQIEEIRTALQSPDKDFVNIKPAAPDKLPENAKKIWFGIDKD